MRIPLSANLGKQFNLDNANGVSTFIEVTDHSNALILVLLYVAGFLQVVSNVTRRLQDVLITVLDDLAGEGLGNRSLILWCLRFRRLLPLLVLLVRLGNAVVARGQRLGRRLRFLQS